MKIPFWLMLLALANPGTAQKIKARSVGDDAAEIKINNVINYKTTTLNLSDFTSGLVIIDFWSTWCAPCVKALPEFQKLQEQLKGKVQFILADTQEKDMIVKYLKAKNIELPCAVEAKELSEYFPHNSVPHEVWIKNGKVIAITYAVSVTRDNIRKVISGEPVALVPKIWNMNFNPRLPLLVNNNGGDEKDLLYHSEITRYIAGLSGGGGGTTDDRGRFKISLFNASVASLYLKAAKYINPYFRLYNQILIDAKNKERIYPRKHPEYVPEIRSLFYCYELIIPVSEKEKAGKIMMQDLNRFFGAFYHIKCDIEEKVTTCWVLRHSNNGVSIKTNNAQPKIEIEDGYELYQNRPFSDFFNGIAYINQTQAYPFVNKTGIKDNVDMRLPYSVIDIPSSQLYLQKLGFKLSLEKCKIQMLVIKDIN